MNKKIVFILGVGRSGTSLLQSMLNSHSEIAFPPETHFFRYYVAPNRKRKQIIKNEPEKFFSVLEQDKSFSRININPQELLSDTNSDFKPEKIYQKLLEIYLNKKGKTIIGDKDPKNIEFVQQLYKYFPQATIIHLIRDPRDVVLSRTKAAWSAHRPLWLHAMIYNSQILTGRKNGIRLFKKNYLEIKYEELISNPKDPLKRIVKNIGLEYEESMLNFSKSGSELMDESEKQWKIETTGPLLRSNVKKWKKELSNQQIGLIQTICRKPMMIYGYSPDNSIKLNFIQRLFFNSIKTAFHIVYLLKLKLT